MPLFIVVLWIAIIAVISVVSATSAGKTRRTISSDGHVVPAKSDPTCEGEYGHDHGPQRERRYIVHDEPNEGYVVLNGVKRKIEDCKYL